MDPSLEVRFRAYSQLQTGLANYPPGSRRYEQTEHALDLALNDGRAVDKFFKRNLLRDSKRTLVRQLSSRRYVVASEDIPQQEESQNNSNVVALVDPVTPESLVAASDLARTIVAQVACSSSHAGRVMQGLLMAETLNETSHASGISAVRVNQLRRALRLAARKEGLGRHD